MKLPLSEGAARDVADLRRHYRKNQRPEAYRNLMVALDRASSRIERDPQAGLAAPRPYPEVEHPGERWIKEGRYWIVYQLATPPVILAVIYDQADLPRRI